jgi:cell growth-regulating nucleolar protein
MRSWGGSPAPEDVDPEKVAVNEKAVVDLVVPVPITVVGETEGDGEGKKKKKKRKGDKGGTGSRANSNALKRDAESATPVTPAAPTVAETQKPAETTKSVVNGDAVKAVAEAPAVVIPAATLASESTSSKSKKRKASSSDIDDSTSESSKKTSKKLRKALSSLAATEKSVPLSTLIEKISAQVSKKKTGEVIDATGIARDIKVKFVDGAAGEEGKWVLEV